MFSRRNSKLWSFSDTVLDRLVDRALNHTPHPPFQNEQTKEDAFFLVESMSYLSINGTNNKIDHPHPLIPDEQTGLGESAIIIRELS